MIAIPSSALAGWWSKPESFAECMKEELEDLSGQQSIKYVKSYCFHKFCEGKGQLIKIDNRVIQEQCLALQSEYSTLTKNWDGLACDYYHKYKEHDCNVSYYLMSAEHSRGCKCDKWLKRANEIEVRFDQLQCNSLINEDFVYNDKTCK
jgi:hypothetical protein